MGVQGLLPMLKSVMDQVNVAKYTGKTVGIDAAGWLYKGCYSCATDVVLGKDTDVYLNFCLQQIKVLQDHNIRPLFVFDGAPLPAKAELNAHRYRTREMWRQKALRALEEGGDAGTATSAFNKSVSVSNALIMKFIAILRRMNIQFIVAPYEADAQLAYLSKLKIVDVVISEDSDCIPYGCRTTLFKWSGDGWASELKRRSLGANEDLSFAGWNEEMFVELCVLCGCDYCPSVPGVGIVTAYKLVNAHKKPVEIVAALKDLRGDKVPASYPETFYSAILTFRHHLVFDPRDEKLKMLNPLAVSGDLVQLVDKELRFLGNLELKDDVVASIAHGTIHPTTHESYAWKETAELQSLTPPEGSSRSMTSSETSSISGIQHAHAAANKHPDSSKSHDRAVPVTDDDEEVGDAHRQPLHAADSRKPSLSSWRHLDGVLGNSTHILNFRSPKVSENFRSLVSSDTQRLQFHAGKTADSMKAFEDIPCKPSLKRVRNPRNRKRDHQTSGFDGEVTCRVDLTEPTTQRLAQRRRLASETSDEMNDLESNGLSATPIPAIMSLYEDAQTTGKRTPFFAQNRQYPPVITCSSLLQDPRPLSPLSGSDRESEVIWAPDTATRRPGSAFNAITARRAVSAEEKWDRILERELDSGSEDDGDATCVSPHASSTTSSRKRFNAKPSASFPQAS